MRPVSTNSLLRAYIISIHAPLTGCDNTLRYHSATFESISIHAPLTGCDSSASILLTKSLIISIHAPLTGCDLFRFTDEVGIFFLFQSTHPLRDATIFKRYCSADSRYFNPRTPYGMRPDLEWQGRFYRKISIHAPLTGCDRESCDPFYSISAFQSTHPLRDATEEGIRPEEELEISIHAPLTGCDRKKRKITT